jgi:3-oxoacyl-[acyl-carrier-protein] synthase III
MQSDADGVRIADVETCDFALLPGFATEEVLRACRPDDWQRCLDSAVARRLIAELGVERRGLTHLPGTPLRADRLTAFDLARSAVQRLRDRRADALAQLDALIFVSTSNPNPCNSQAALLAREFGITASCMDLKAGCSSGVLGIMHAALLIRSGCARVLVVMAENLSQLTPPADLRMLLTVGDGAACVLVERAEAGAFLSMIHGTDPALADAFAVRESFPPARADARYVYEFNGSNDAPRLIHRRWRSLLRKSTAAARIAITDLDHCFIHQTHAAHLTGLAADLDIEPARMPAVVGTHGNMGSPTFAVAMAGRFAALAPGARYLMQAVGGGVSWCSIVARHG